MEASEDIQSWAERHNLSAETRAVLKENGFTTVQELAFLTPADIKEAFQDSGLLNIAQCLALKRAVASLSSAQNTTPYPTQHQHDPIQNQPYPSGQTYPTQNQLYPNLNQPNPTPSQPDPSLHDQPYHSLNQPRMTINQSHYPSSSHPYPPQGYPYPSQGHPYPSQAQPQPYPFKPQTQPPVSYPHSSPSHLPQSNAPYPIHQFSGPQENGFPQSGDFPGQSWSSVAAQSSSTWGGVAGAGAMEEGVPPGLEGPGEIAECFRFLLLGKTGSGKSTTGNTIFGEPLFNTAATFASVTSECERQTNTRGGRKIEIMDSPGLYDTHKTQEEISVVIVQAVAGMHPGPHAILYVVRLGRYTQEEHGAYQRLKALFDETICRYLIVVFTYGDMLERDGKSISDLLGPETPQNLQQVLRECNNRYIVFNNMASDLRPQVERLLQMVRQMVKENGGQPYSCPKYGRIGEGMEEEVARRLQEVEKRDLQRQKYVQELEQKTQEATETARKTQEQFQKNEEERRCRMKEEEKRRRQLEEQLENQRQEQQIGFEKFQQELQRMHQEREEQERMMKEREAQMTENERKREEEVAARMRQQEQEMQVKLKQQEELLQRQKKEEEERRQQMERERQEFMKLMEDQRQKDREELAERERERERLREEQREEERAAARKREENYEKEMEELKSQVVAKQNTDFIANCVAALTGAVHVLAEIGRAVMSFQGDAEQDSLQSSGRPSVMAAQDGQGMAGRDLFGVPHSDGMRRYGYASRVGRGMGIPVSYGMAGARRGGRMNGPDLFGVPNAGDSSEEDH